MASRVNKELSDYYYKKGYWGDKTLRDYFIRAVKQFPNKTAVVDPYKRKTFSELADMVNNIINGLAQLGIKSNDTVAYQLPNLVESHAIHTALRMMGVVTCPIIPIYREKELEFILNETNAKAIFIPEIFRGHNYISTIKTIKDRLPNLENIIVLGKNAPDGMSNFHNFLDLGRSKEMKIDINNINIDPDDVSLICYTSGTTSNPKGVLHTNNTRLFAYRNFKINYNLSNNTSIFMGSPITHASGLSGLELSIFLGAKITYLDIWDVEKGAELISRERCNFTISSTPFLQWLVESDVSERYDLTSMEKFVCGGAYIPPELIKKAPSSGIRAVRTYGSTECPALSQGKLDDPLNITAITDGKITPGYKVKIVGDDGVELPVGCEGEIVAKGPQLFIGYLDNKLNADSFDEEGFFYTGDLGRIQEGGYIVITGRKKDIIIRGGENISTKEIEDLLYEHPSVEQVAIVAMPDKKLGEKACAYIKVAPNKDFSFDEMIEYLMSKNLAKQKLPERLELIDEFPLNASGKILKTELRKMIAEKIGLDPIK